MTAGLRPAVRAAAARRGSCHNLTRRAVVKHRLDPLPNWPSDPKGPTAGFGFTCKNFRRMFIAAFRSAFNRFSERETYNPRFTRRPDGIHPDGLKPYTGRVSPSSADETEV